MNQFFTSTQDFKEQYSNQFVESLSKPMSHCSTGEKYMMLVRLIRSKINSLRTETSMRHLLNQEKKIYYFSMEFLVGRLLENYLLNLGVLDLVRAALDEMGEDLDSICEIERDPGLGNGGLGRLAACFMDSMAFLGVPGVGMGVRHRFGLFKQRIENGFQKEEPDNWLEDGYPWELRKPDDTVEIRFGGEIERHYDNGVMTFKHKNYHSINAVPYDVPIVGYGGETVNVLRLWNAEPSKEVFDLAAFNRGDYAAASRDRAETEAITMILYPDDSTVAGKTLRLKQEYFFTSAGIASILRSYKAAYGEEAWDDFPKHVVIHTNDTHPALCGPELMRRLIDDEGLSWEKAWAITTQCVAFTNHTILPEALEKWPIDMVRNLIPRVYMIIEEIDRRYREGFDHSIPDWHDRLQATAILWDGTVRMANLSIICSFSVNGVAALHTEILKKDTLKDFYQLRPEMFNNKTNGVSHRRFMIQSNPGLANLITDTIGDSWIRNPDHLEDLLKYQNDTAVLAQLRKIKHQNKLRLAAYIKKHNGVDVDPDSVFDIQVKRIHAYKRQLLNAFRVLDLYNQLKENPSLDIVPQTFVFAGKAAQSYVLAKEIIKFICSLAQIVNNDPDVNKKMKVIFIENYCVSNAQLIYPAADISEQISTASKEASGTGNMKFMFNGAVTLGTEDGANVEIHELVGDDNIGIFGLSSDEVLALYANRSYVSSIQCDSDPRLKKMCDQLIHGFFSQKVGYDFWRIHNSLIQDNDEFFVLKDFDAYVKMANKLLDIYRNEPDRWSRMSLVNIAKSGKFTSDRTIIEYSRDIWHTRYDQY